jgi:hypothetical protein
MAVGMTRIEAVLAVPEACQSYGNFVHIYDELGYGLQQHERQTSTSSLDVTKESWNRIGNKVFIFMAKIEVKIHIYNTFSRIYAISVS